MRGLAPDAAGRRLAIFVRLHLEINRPRQGVEVLISAVLGAVAPWVLVYALVLVHQYFGRPFVVPGSWWGDGHSSSDIAAVANISDIVQTALEYLWGFSLAVLLYKPASLFFRQVPTVVWPTFLISFLVSLAFLYRKPEVFPVLLQTPLLSSFVAGITINAVAAWRTHAA